MTTGMRHIGKVPLTLSDNYVSLGWWMVMSDNEQGYAPAAYLEPMDNSVADNDVQTSTDEGEMNNK